MAQDDDLAVMVGDDDGPQSWRPRLTEYSPEASRLDAIFDRLGELIAATYAVASGSRPQDVPPAPRPETARERLERERTDAAFDALVADIEAASARARGGDQLLE